MFEQNHEVMLRSILDELRNVRERVETMDARLTLVLQKEDVIMATVDDIVTDVAAEGTVIDSAVALLNGLKAALDAAGTDPAKLAQLKTDIEAKSSSLAQAVAANTPAAPGPTGGTTTP